MVFSHKCRLNTRYVLSTVYNYFIAVAALAISIFTVVNDSLLQVIFKTEYGWRMIFWEILFIGGISYMVSRYVYSIARSYFNNEAYMLSILEEIEYCDKKKETLFQGQVRDECGGEELLHR